MCPKLPCPECGEALIEASGRGRYDDDGNFIEHRLGPYCDWMWFDDIEPVRCECGTWVGIEVDDGAAYTVSRGATG